MWGVLSTTLLAFALFYPNVDAAACGSGFNWMYNSLGQSPCDIASALLAVCIPSQGPLPQVPAGSYYNGPDVNIVDECTCSSVFYSMLGACSLCQGGTTSSWSKYATNCTTVYLQTFPDPLPAGVRVPHYAYLDVTATGSFDSSAAQVAGGSESASGPSATSTTVQATQSTGPTQTAGKKSNVGAIVGGVVAGIAVLGIAVAAVVWVVLRERRLAEQRRASSAFGQSPANRMSFASSVKQSPQQQQFNLYPNTFSANHPPQFQPASNPQQVQET